MWFKCLILKEVLNQLKEIEASKAKMNAIIESSFLVLKPLYVRRTASQLLETLSA